MESETNSVYKRELKRLVYGLAKCYAIRPKNGSDAAEVCRVLCGHDIASTLGKLSKSGDDPAQIVHEYQLASDSLKSGTLSDRFYLSLKPPALNFDPEYAAAIVAKALQNGHGVHFDAHAFSHADPTLRLLEAVMERKLASSDTTRSWSFGLTLPSRWKRSLADARWAAKKGVRPRLVKGDFKGGASDEVDPEKGFLALVDQLAGDVSELAVATHDCALAREAVTRCRRAGSSVQLELFFGMPSGSMMALSRELEVPVRFYVPYGDTLLIYVIRDLLSNPHKILRRSSFEVLGSQETKLTRIIGSL
jgi:proline dehydrogenase